MAEQVKPLARDHGTGLPIIYTSACFAASISSIRLGSLFLTLPTRGLTGPQVISSAGQGGAIHSTTSSARARIDGGTVRPRALAVFRLTANW